MSFIMIVIYSTMLFVFSTRQVAHFFCPLAWPPPSSGTNTTHVVNLFIVIRTIIQIA